MRQYRKIDREFADKLYVGLNQAYDARLWNYPEFVSDGGIVGKRKGGVMDGYLTSLGKRVAVKLAAAMLGDKYPYSSIASEYFDAHRLGRKDKKEFQPGPAFTPRKKHVRPANKPQIKRSVIAPEDQVIGAKPASKVPLVEKFVLRVSSEYAYDLPEGEHNLRIVDIMESGGKAIITFGL